MLQQNIFLRGSDALPGRLREDFEKMLAVHSDELEKNLRKERERLETERETRLNVERETMEKQLNVERERMNLDLEKERSQMRQASRETEDKVREELREEMERMRAAFESEKVLLRNTVIKERDEALMTERQSREVERIRETELLKEKIRSEVTKEQHKKFLEEKEMLRRQVRDEYEKKASDEKQYKFTSKQQQKNDREVQMKENGRKERSPGESEEESNAEAIKSQRGRVFDGSRVNESLWNDFAEVGDEKWLANDRIQHTKQWVEKQYRFTSDSHEYVEDSTGLEGAKDGEEKIDIYDRHRQEPQHCRNDMDNWERDNSKLERGDIGKGLLKRQGHSDNEEDAVQQGQGRDAYRDNVISESGIKSNSREFSEAKNSEKNTEFNTRALKEENEGLKAKVAALQENIELHECFKKEATDEVQRLRTANKDLKMKLEELKELKNDCEELKAVLKNCKGKLKDNEVQMKNKEEKIKEYEDICAEYERTLQKCRQRIMVIENDRAMQTTARGKPVYTPKLPESPLKDSKEPNYGGMRDSDDNSDYNAPVRTQGKPGGQMVRNNNL